MKLFKNKKLANLFLVALVLLAINVFLLRPVLGNDVFFPSHDSTWIIRLHQFDRAIKLGQLPPRLAPDMAFGFGYPLFKYYAPLFTFLSWLIFKVVGSYSLAVILTVFLSNFLGCWGMFLLAKNFWGFWGGVLSSIAFLFLPYRALDIYVRGAFAELLAINILPFGFYFFFKIVNANKHPQKRDVAGFIFSSFFFILAHNLYLVLLAYLSPLILIYLSFKFKKRGSNYGLIVISGLIALFLTSFYWLPMISGLFDIGATKQALKTVYQDHFVYLQQIWNWNWGFGGSAAGLKDGMSFKAGKLQIILAVIGFTVGILKSKKRKEIILLASLGIAALILSLTVSNFIWGKSLLLPFVQFPWRFLGVFGLGIAFFSGAVLSFKRSRFVKIVLFLGVIGGLVFLNYKYFVPQKVIADANEYFLIKERVEKDAALEIREYFPVGVKETPETKPKSAIEAEPDQVVDVVLDSPFKIIFRVDPPAGGKIIANRFYFPGWQAEREGKLLIVEPNNIDGRIVFSANDTGEYVLNFVATTVEKISWGLSLLGVFILFLFLIY